MSTLPASEFEHARGWLVDLMNERVPRPMRAPQRCCPELVPGLTARAFWHPSDFAWSTTLTTAFPTIKKELLGLRGQGTTAYFWTSVVARLHLTRSLRFAGGFQAYRAPAWSQASKSGKETDTAELKRESPCEPDEAKSAAPDMPTSAKDGTRCCFHSLLFGSTNPTVHVCMCVSLSISYTEDLGEAGTDAGVWNVYYLHLHNADYEYVRLRSPPSTISTAFSFLATQVKSRQVPCDHGGFGTSRTRVQALPLLCHGSPYTYCGTQWPHKQKTQGSPSVGGSNSCASLRVRYTTDSACLRWYVARQVMSLAPTLAIAHINSVVCCCLFEQRGVLAKTQSR